ncbi:MAG TPA: NAD(P)/FAD-dependent oxidoreductase, partial [Ilumatobacteraceae bacterium]|nr:NAD(P)/FAD-dependent oxidoreductase [Ilumatobacteraceae bacterium]
MAQDQVIVPELSPEELRRRYEEERDKRKRPEGIYQYREAKGVYKDFDADPFADPNFTRDPVVEETDVFIVGGGWGGMATAIELTKAGNTSFRIADKAGDFGGTWYWNRYPGCMCDVESYIYLPYLEDTGYVPKHKYSYATEIFAYAQLLGRQFNLYDKALFQTEVEEVRWNDDASRWMIRTSRGDQIAARFLVIAGGVLHKAKLPAIPGIETFNGPQFHTSRWDYSITGGDPDAAMDKLGDKRVAIIGTGATAVQVIPKLAEAAEHVYVFQRTPSTVGVRDQRPTDPDEFAQISAEPGWQRRRAENFTGNITSKDPAEDLVDDAWTQLLKPDTKRAPKDAADAAWLEQVDFEKMAGIRQRIASIVKDQATAEALMPWYKVGCKRPCFHDDYLPAFNRDNVTLVDTLGQGVEAITPTGVVANGVEYPVDMIVYASGFEVTTFYTHRLGFDIQGLDDVWLSESWAEGAHTLHGVWTKGFPNLCMNSSIQSTADINFGYTITQMSEHTAHVLNHCL